jgi:hypothetical protein
MKYLNFIIIDIKIIISCNLKITVLLKYINLITNTNVFHLNSNHLKISDLFIYL